MSPKDRVKRAKGDHMIQGCPKPRMLPKLGKNRTLPTLRTLPGNESSVAHIVAPGPLSRHRRPFVLPLPGLRALVLCLLMLPAFFGGQAHANVFTRPCALFGVEPALAMAIARVESGWHPYCVNVAGKDHYPQSLEDAARLARDALRQGRSVDVGLMQINSYWLKKWNVPPERALIPAVNVTLGLVVLAHEMRRHGPTWKAVGYYHSPNARRQARYVQKVAREREAIVAALARARDARDSVGKTRGPKASPQRRAETPSLKAPLPSFSKESASPASNPGGGTRGKSPKTRDMP